MRTTKALLGIALLFGAAGCATTQATECSSKPITERPAPSEYTVHELGDHFTTVAGHCKVIRVQDGYRLIRCVTTGRIQGCYEDLLTVPRLDLELMTWRPVEGVDGLELAFITPDQVAVRQTYVLEVAPELHAHSDGTRTVQIQPLRIRKGNPAAFAKADR